MLLFTLRIVLCEKGNCCREGCWKSRCMKRQNRQKVDTPPSLPPPLPLPPLLPPPCNLSQIKPLSRWYRDIFDCPASKMTIGQEEVTFPLLPRIAPLAPPFWPETTSTRTNTRANSKLHFKMQQISDHGDNVRVSEDACIYKFMNRIM